MNSTDVNVLTLLATTFLIVGVFMAVLAIWEMRNRLRTIMRILTLWAANERPEFFLGLHPKKHGVPPTKMEDSQIGHIWMNGELFACRAKGTIEADDPAVITQVSGRVFVIEKGKT